MKIRLSALVGVLGAGIAAGSAVYFNTLPGVLAGTAVGFHASLDSAGGRDVGSSNAAVTTDSSNNHGGSHVAHYLSNKRDSRALRFASGVSAEGVSGSGGALPGEHAGAGELHGSSGGGHSGGSSSNFFSSDLRLAASLDGGGTGGATGAGGADNPDGASGSIGEAGAVDQQAVAGIASGGISGGGVPGGSSLQGNAGGGDSSSPGLGQTGTARMTVIGSTSGSSKGSGNYDPAQSSVADPGDTNSDSDPLNSGGNSGSLGLSDGSGNSGSGPLAFADDPNGGGGDADLNTDGNGNPSSTGPNADPPDLIITPAISVPEPASLPIVLAGLGLIGAVIYAHKRRLRPPNPISFHRVQRRKMI